MAEEGSPRLLRLSSTIPLFFLAAAALFHVSYSSDTDVLLRFKGTISGMDQALPDWVPGSSPCIESRSNWTGVICDGGNVYGLQLESMKLSGTLVLDPLGALGGLRTLSFADNNLVGLMPSLDKVGALKALYLSRNNFSGVIPDDAFSSTMSLKKVHLSENRFSGPIPSSLAEVSKLLELMLDGNQFSGTVPNLRQPGLKLVNVSDNNLEGPIPESLRQMDSSLFAGNKALCGAPLRDPCNSTNTHAAVEASHKSKKLSTLLEITIIVIVITVVALALLIVIFCIKHRRQGTSEKTSQTLSSKQLHRVEPTNVDKLEQGVPLHSSVAMKAPKEVEHGKLVFVSEGGVRFQLQDLLKASAQVLGSGNFGSSYKAVLANNHAVVVKRFREMNGVGREDFQEHMRRLGRLSHPNLLPLLSYYYRREEKLLVTNYFPVGSLAHLLHQGIHGSNLPSLDWTTRLRIVKGVGRGLAYLYDELPMIDIPHGHLKSSNVLLNENYEPLLTDYALVPVMNKSHASQILVAYKSPEFIEYGRISRKSDVWSFGILILEILTGKFPANYLRPNKCGADLASWVNSVVKEEWTSEVFDPEMKGTRNSESDMLKLLKIGLDCCERDEEKRCELKDALAKIEELRRVVEGDEPNSYVSEGEIMSFGIVTEDDLSFSKTHSS
ncbi:hypothetical protein J5N97_021559 [Dioscorea zingiberensis]|uniref:non-specific serine/threonine protein kinase n=1 Tax=Dioscorea zingiberensis TaxID=325984 RepID=A0A9D5C9R6_9LILI|nr:hypothetical protein J5N97_021559 [Dioscorea zingiberensis]